MIVKVPIKTPFFDTKGEVDRVWQIFFQGLANADPLASTHADRIHTLDGKLDKNPPSRQAPGTLLRETDRTVTYRVHEDSVTGARSWVYDSGTMQGTLSPDLKPTGLGTDDTGFLFWSTDYEHLYRWTGAAWDYAPGDQGSGFIQLDTAAPTTGVWALADGSGTTRSTATGTLSAFTTPDLTGQFIKGGTYTGSTVSAAIPGITGSTGDESAHTHTIDHDHPSESSGGPSGTTVVQSGTGTTVASSSHGHTTDLAALTGASGAGSAHHHGVGTLALAGAAEPAHVLLAPYFRR
jgi:hypothetical protein